MIRSTRLDNGITVVTEKMPHVLSVTAGFWVGTGSRDEDPSLSGASHFLEHLLFKGSPTRSAADIAEAVDAVGGDMNAFTTKELTAFYIRTLAESLELGLDILSDVMWHPAFRPEEVEAERQVILEEILMRNDEPSDLVHDLVLEAAFPDHGLGRDVLGDESSIEAMEVDAIRGFHRHHYRPGNIVVSLAGALDHQRVVDLVAQAFDGEEGGAPPVRRRPTAEPVQVVVSPRPTEQAHLVLAFPTPGRHHADRYALSVLDHILGGGLSSRLFQEIRERHGLAYSVYSYRSSFEDTGLFSFYAGTAPGRAHEVLERMTQELDKAVRHGLTDRELAVAKGHMRGETALSLEDSAARMSRIGRSQLLHGEVLEVEEVIGRVEAVSLDDLHRVCSETLARSPLLAVVGPFDDSAFAPPKVA